MTRLTLIALLLILAVLALWLSVGTIRATRRELTARTNAFGLTGASAPHLSWGGGHAADVPPGGPSPVRAVESATYTAMPGDGPVSEAGPGDVTHLYPPSRVTYVTTPNSDAPAVDAEPEHAMPEPGAAPSREEEPPPLPSAPAPATAKRGDRSLDRAIEGAMETPPRSEEAPGQYR